MMGQLYRSLTRSKAHWQWAELAGDSINRDFRLGHRQGRKKANIRHNRKYKLNQTSTFKMRTQPYHVSTRANQPESESWPIHDLISSEVEVGSLHHTSYNAHERQISADYRAESLSATDLKADYLGFEDLWQKSTNPATESELSQEDLNGSLDFQEGERHYIKQSERHSSNRGQLESRRTARQLSTPGPGYPIQRSEQRDTLRVNEVSSNRKTRRMADPAGMSPQMKRYISTPQRHEQMWNASMNTQPPRVSFWEKLMDEEARGKRHDRLERAVTDLRNVVID
jgi:hypothetical protein